MSMLIISSLQLGFIYAIMALGVYISFRILNIPDLTVDGSFTLGMAVCAVLSVNGHPFLAILVGGLAGLLAGLVTGLLQTKLSIHPILSGILTMTGLYSVNLFIMGGKANISLYGRDTLFSLFDEFLKISSDISKLILAILVCAVVTIILSILFKTKLGMSIRATGDNEEMVRSSSINANFTKCVGLAIANCCVAISGALLCQYQMYVDIGFGSGMVVIGLASVIIGESLFGKHSVTFGLMLAVVGSVVYRIIIALALKIDLFPSYGLKLISAVIVAIALCMPAVKTAMQARKARRKVLSDHE